MKNLMRALFAIANICMIGLCLGCGCSGNNPPQPKGIINSDSAESYVANALVMSQMASVGVEAGFHYDHFANLNTCVTGTPDTVASNSERLDVIYDSCMMGSITWDGRIIISTETTYWQYDINFGDAANNLIITQSETTVYFPYLDTGEVFTLKGDIFVIDHGDVIESRIEDLNLYHRTLNIQFLDANFYNRRYVQNQTQEIFFRGEIHSNLLRDIECLTYQDIRFVANKNSYPSEGVMLITALYDGSNVIVTANADASTVTLKIDTDANILIDNEITTTWSSLENHVNSSIRELFEFYWKYE